MAKGVKSGRKSSINRITSEFRGVPISDITLVLALKDTKDWKQVRRVLGKQPFVPKKEGQKDTYAPALTRLASQYIRLMANAPLNEIKYIEQKYKVRLEPKNYVYNIGQMGNVRSGPRKPKPNTAERIMKLGFNLNFLVKTKKGYKIRVQYSVNNMNKVITNLGLSDEAIRILNSMGIYYYQMKVKILFDDRTEGYLSCKTTNVGNLMGVDELFEKIQSHILTEDEYLYHLESKIIKRMILIEVQWIGV